MGFANSPNTRSVLASHGIRVGGYRWRWRLGLKGGTFPPHFHQNNEYATDSGDFEALPGADVNGDSCMCALVPQYRTPDGRFAKPGLEPVFQPPTTAALELLRPEPIDWSPLVAVLTDRQQVFVTIPDGAIVVNVPEPRVVVNAPTVNVDAPIVNVAPPAVTVEAPTVNVAPPEVHVDAPIVTVEPQINVTPAKVSTVMKPPRETRIIRDNAGTIVGMEEVR